MNIVATVLLKTLKGMALAALSERVVKKLIIEILEAVVKKTETKADDRILDLLKREWDK